MSGQNNGYFNNHKGMENQRRTASKETRFSSPGGVNNYPQTQTMYNMSNQSLPTRSHPQLNVTTGHLLQPRSQVTSVPNMAGFAGNQNLNAQRVGQRVIPQNMGGSMAGNPVQRRVFQNPEMVREPKPGFQNGSPRNPNVGTMCIPQPKHVIRCIQNPNMFIPNNTGGFPQRMTGFPQQAGQNVFFQNPNTVTNQFPRPQLATAVRFNNPQQMFTPVIQGGRVSNVFASGQMDMLSASGCVPQQMVNMGQRGIPSLNMINQQQLSTGGVVPSQERVRMVANQGKSGTFHSPNLTQQIPNAKFGWVPNQNSNAIRLPQQMQKVEGNGSQPMFCVLSNKNSNVTRLPQRIPNSEGNSNISTVGIVPNQNSNVFSLPQQMRKTEGIGKVPTTGMTFNQNSNVLSLPQQMRKAEEVSKVPITGMAANQNSNSIRLPQQMRKREGVSKVSKTGMTLNQNSNSVRLPQQLQKNEGNNNLSMVGMVPNQNSNDYRLPQQMRKAELNSNVPMIGMVPNQNSNSIRLPQQMQRAEGNSNLPMIGMVPSRYQIPTMAIKSTLMQQYKAMQPTTILKDQRSIPLSKLQHQSPQKSQYQQQNSTDQRMLSPNQTKGSNQEIILHPQVMQKLATETKNPMLQPTQDARLSLINDSYHHSAPLIPQQQYQNRQLNISSQAKPQLLNDPWQPRMPDGNQETARSQMINFTQRHSATDANMAIHHLNQAPAAAIPITYSPKHSVSNLQQVQQQVPKLNISVQVGQRPEVNVSITKGSQQQIIPIQDRQQLHYSQLNTFEQGNQNLSASRANVFQLNKGLHQYTIPCIQQQKDEKEESMNNSSEPAQLALIMPQSKQLVKSSQQVGIPYLQKEQQAGNQKINDLSQDRHHIPANHPSAPMSQQTHADIPLIRQSNSHSLPYQQQQLKQIINQQRSTLGPDLQQFPSDGKRARMLQSNQMPTVPLFKASYERSTNSTITQKIEIEQKMNIHIKVQTKKQFSNGDTRKTMILNHPEPVITPAPSLYQHLIPASKHQTDQPVVQSTNIPSQTIQRPSIHVNIGNTLQSLQTPSITMDHGSVQDSLMYRIQQQLQKAETAKAAQQDTSAGTTPLPLNISMPPLPSWMQAQQVPCQETNVGSEADEQATPDKKALPLSQMYHYKDLNILHLIGLGLQNVHYIIRATMSLCTIRTENQANFKILIQENKRNLSSLFHTLRMIFKDVEEKCREEGIDQVDVESLVPLVNELEPEKDLSQMEEYEKEYEKNKNLSKMATGMNREIQDVIEITRTTINELNIMLSEQ